MEITEILRRINLEIYDPEEYEKDLVWAKESCKEGIDINKGKNFLEGMNKSRFISEDRQWEFCVKHVQIVKAILHGNPKLAELGGHEEVSWKKCDLGRFLLSF